MQEPLNIPLDPMSATRHSRRVAPLYAAIAVGAVLGAIIYRFPFAISETLGFKPETTIASVRIVKNGETKKAMVEHAIGDISLVGTPWTLRTLFAESNREITVHMLPSGKIAVTVDTGDLQGIGENVAAFGYSAIVHEGRTLLAPSHTVTKLLDTGNEFVMSGFLPGNVGEVHTEEGIMGISLSKKGVTLHGAGFIAPKQSSLLPITNATVLAAVNIPAGLLAYPQASADLVGTPTGELLELALLQGGAFLLTKDGKGTGFFLSMDPQDLSVETMASVGKDIMNRHDLSTRTLTSADGEEFDEIFGNSEALDIDIQADEDFTFITVENPSGDTLRLARTEHVFTVANRDISFENEEKIRSSCMLSAHSWVTREAFMTLDNIFGTNQESAQAMFMDLFSEIAVNRHDVRLCW